MEESTPVDKERHSHGDGSVIPCGLGTKIRLEDIFEEEDFVWLDKLNPVVDAFDLNKKDDNLDAQVNTCYCQAPPCYIPYNFTPCCLPSGVVLATREIQMAEVFHVRFSKKISLVLMMHPPKHKRCVTGVRHVLPNTTDRTPWGCGFGYGGGRGTRPLSGGCFGRLGTN